MVALFSAITVAFALIAVWTATAGRYPIALAAAAALAAWMGDTRLGRTKENAPLARILPSWQGRTRRHSGSSSGARGDKGSATG